MIRKLREFQIGQVIRQEGPATHRKKAGTPTMGGLLILASVVLIPTLMWADLANQFVWIAVLATAAFGGIGFADDYLKIVRKSHHGLLPRYKMGWQIVVGVGVGVALIVLNSENLYSTRPISRSSSGSFPTSAGSTSPSRRWSWSGRPTRST